VPLTIALLGDVMLGRRVGWTLRTQAPESVRSPELCDLTRSYNAAPGSFALHAAAAEPGIVARKLAKPEISAEWSILWSARAQSASIERFLGRRSSNSSPQAASPAV
jgi:hypothetical protein